MTLYKKVNIMII